MSRRSRITTGAVLIALTSVVLGGCGDDADEQGSTPTPTVSTPASPASTPSPSATAATSAPAAAIEAAAAVEVALSQEKGAAVVSLEQSTDGGTPVWEVELLTTQGAGTQLAVDQATGKVVSTTPADLDSEQRTAPKVTATEAIEIAEKKASGDVVEMSLSDEAGKTVWDVEVRPTSGASQELTIDASTGAVLHQESADD